MLKLSIVTQAGGISCSPPLRIPIKREDGIGFFITYTMMKVYSIKLPYCVINKYIGYLGGIKQCTGDYLNTMDKAFQTMVCEIATPIPQVLFMQYLFGITSPLPCALPVRGSDAAQFPASAQSPSTARDDAFHAL